MNAHTIAKGVTVSNQKPFCQNLTTNSGDQDRFVYQCIYGTLVLVWDCL